MRMFVMIKAMLAAKVRPERCSRDRKAESCCPRIIGSTPIDWPSRYRLNTALTSGSRAEAPTKPSPAVITSETTASRETAREIRMSSEKMPCVRSTWFRPMYFPHRICEPPTSMVLTAPSSWLTGAYRPMALMATAPTELLAKRLETMPFTAPTAQSKI